MVKGLEICFCHPKHQGQGAGTQLVEWGVKKADELRIPAFVEASSTGAMIYEKCGFRSIEHVSITHERWPTRPTISYTLMFRPSKGICPT